AGYRLPRGFVVTGQIELVSDPGYLFLYDYSDKDRLANELALTRVREKDLFRASITEFRTLRESEIPIRDTLPDRYVEVSYIRDLDFLNFGGRTTARVDAAALDRPSSVDGDGRDVSRVGVGINWLRSELIGAGIVASGELGVRVDAYNVGQDSAFATNLTRIVPRAAAELRWPFARTTDDGGTELLEPILRFDFANTGGDTVPLEDSRIVEFDEANLFSSSRYPGIDGVEDGARVAAGLSWQRDDPDGWAFDLTFGRIASLDGSLGFEDGSGLEGDQSEWLLAGKLALSNQLQIASRSLFDDKVAFTLSETRVDWQGDRGRLGSSYIFAEPEPAEGRDTRLSEFSMDGEIQLTENWTASTDWQYDFSAGRATRVGLGLDYENECIRLDLSLSRRFATSTSVTPTTGFGFRVSLIGVGNGTNARNARRVCRG
ncbi:MAG: LPS-assembly protein LptD, partial [Boseongicola sp.]